MSCSTTSRREGAEAARNGLSLLNCPYLKAAEMPAHTGESPGDWIQRVAAWEEGWKNELAQRGARRSASPFATSDSNRPPDRRVPVV
ncbi:CrpP-related protein [Achromobacter spanius]|uniref:CrpP-related protein n=1 Tax=Achromobacter spanius TaxID=217203 RepID=UPI0037F3C42D